MATPFDYYTTHQVYLEGYKDGEVAEHESMFDEIAAVILVLLARYGVAHMGELSRSQLSGFTGAVSREVVRIFNREERLVTANLKRFLKVDREAFLTIFGMTNTKEPRTNLDKLWNDAANTPIGGIGLEPGAVFASVLASMVHELKSTIKAAYADRNTPAELARAIVGTKANKFKDGTIIKLKRQMRTGINTVIQHMSQSVVFTLGALAGRQYTWVAVLDSRTTTICRDRNGHVYDYADGPRPPAHWGCRSFIVPVTAVKLAEIPTFYTWIKTQPTRVQDDVLGVGRGRKLRKGDLVAEDLPGFDYTKPLTLDQYETKVKEVLKEVA